MKTKCKELAIVVFLLTLVSLCFAAWDNDKPADNQTWNTAAASIRANMDALEVELGIDLAEAHPYYQSAAPSTKPDGSTALDVDDNGRIWVDSDDNTIYVLTDYSGPTWTSAAASGNVSTADATFTLQNTDEEDSDGGRQSRWINKGEQSGGEATTLGYMEFSHDDTGDDEKGQFLIKVNDGDDGNSPSKQPIGYLSTGKIDVSSSLSVLDEDDMASDDDEVVATQQSIKAYVDAQTALSAYTSEDSDTNAMLAAHAYKAATAGFVAVRLGLGNDGDWGCAYVGLTDDPAGAGTLIQKTSVSSATGNHDFFFAVAKDEYFEITLDAGATADAIYWKSIGTLSKPIDQD